MGPTNQVGFLIQHLAFTLGRQSDQVLQEQLGIGFSQFKILMVLKKQPHMQQKQIADALAQTEASISRQIKLMHDRGLLQTTVRPENRREHITTLTTKGLRLTEEAVRILQNYHAPMFEQLNAKQQKQLTDLLCVLHDYICQPGNQTCRHFINK